MTHDAWGEEDEQVWVEVTQVRPTPLRPYAPTPLRPYATTPLHLKRVARGGRAGVCRSHTGYLFP